MHTSLKKSAVVRLIVSVVPLVSLAADNVFTGSGLWSDSSLWSLGHLPTTAESAWINGSAGLDSSQTTAGLNVQGTLDLSGAETAFASSGTILIGCNTTNGTLTQTDGRFAANSYFYVGELTTGRVSFVGANVSVVNTFVVGHNSKGIGFFTQYGGSLDFRGNTVISSGANAVGTMTLSNVVMTCTNNNAFTVANATGYFAATNSLLILTDFNVANPTGGAKGTAEVVGSSVSARDITSGNNVAAVGKLRFDACSVTARNLYAGRESQANGWIGFNQSSVTSTASLYAGEKAGSYGEIAVSQSWVTVAGSIYIGEEARSRGRFVMNDSETATPTFYVGQDAAATGSVTLAGGLLSLTSGLYVGNNGAGVFSNLSGTVAAANIGIAQTSSTADGYLYCGPGSLTEAASYFQVGRWGTGVVDCYGTINANSDSVGLFIGNLTNAVGTFNLYPGARLTVRNQLILGFTCGTGLFNQYGGDAVVSNIIGIAGNNASYSETRGSYTLYDGTLTACQNVYVGRYGTGVLHVAGGAMTVPSSTLYIASGTGSSGELNLTGGRLGALVVRGNLGTSALYFDGGTLAAAANRSDFLYGVTQAEVRPGGAVVDTDGHDVTAAQSIAHDSRDGAAAKDGGLTKLGDGTLTLTGTLGFTGDLGANGGTLNLSSATYSLASGAGLWGNGTLVPPATGLSIPADGFVAPGDTNGVGTLTVSGNLTVNGQLRAKISADGSTCGTLAVTGSLVLSEGSGLAIDNPEAFVKGTNYTFISAGSLSGTPAVENLPSSWVLKTSDNQVRAVYLSGTLISVH